MLHISRNHNECRFLFSQFITLIGFIDYSQLFSVCNAFSKDLSNRPTHSLPEMSLKLNAWEPLNQSACRILIRHHVSGRYLEPLANNVCLLLAGCKTASAFSVLLADFSGTGDECCYSYKLIDIQICSFSIPKAFLTTGRHERVDYCHMINWTLRQSHHYLCSKVKFLLFSVPPDSS